jgi:glycosyltransferase involved in cell wall biosynthesis
MNLPAQAPLVSICLPVYNGDPFLADAVASVLAQTHRDFELLIFDDASTDGCLARLGCIKDPRLTIHRNLSNLGPEANWNQAMAAAKGRYIKLFHQDDLLAPDCLALQVEVLEQFPEAALAFCGRTILRSDGRPFLVRTPPWPEGLVQAQGLLRACIRAGTNLIGEPSAVLFRKASAEAAGKFDGSIPYLIDLDYWMRLLAQGPAYCLKRPLASFRISSRQWSAAIGQQQSRQFIAFQEKIAGQGRFQLDRWTLLRGRLMANLNGLLRALVHRWAVGSSR